MPAATNASPIVNTPSPTLQAKQSALIVKYNAGSYSAALDAREKEIARRNAAQVKYGTSNYVDAVAARNKYLTHKAEVISRYDAKDYDSAIAIRNERINRAAGKSTPSTNGFFSLLPQLWGSGSPTGGETDAVSADNGGVTGSVEKSVNSLVVIGGVGVAILFLLKHRKGK